MRIDIATNDSWRALSEEFRSALALSDPGVHIQVYAGYQHALHESTHGLARLFSHKRSIALVEPAEPALAALAVTFAAETYNVRHWTDDDIGSIDPSDLAFVLFSDDDPVTGRLFDHSRLIAAIKDQRIFRIHISHAEYRALHEVPRPAPFEVRIFSLSPELAVLAAGERFRVQPQLAPMLSWNSGRSPQKPLARIAAPAYEAQKRLILDFESQLPQGFRPYFAPGEARVFDRAVIVVDGVDGSAVIDEVADSLKLSLPSAGQETRLEATSPCRWSAPRFTDWLVARGDAEETVRGLIIIEPSLLQEPNFSQTLATAAARLRALQG